MNRKNKQPKKRVRFWNSIRFRVFTGLILTFGVGGLILCLTVENQLNQNLEQRIQEECISLRTNAQIYSRQILMMRGENNNLAGLTNCAQEILTELARTGNRRLFLYSTDGVLTDQYPREGASMDHDQQQLEQTTAFRRALNEEAAFTMRFGSGDSCLVYFSTPVQVAGEVLGILGAVMDYSSIRQTNLQTMHMMVQIVCAGYLLSGLVVFLLLWSVTRPLKLLSRISGKISRIMKHGNSRIPNALEDSRLTRRKDEIGELAVNYSQMMQTIPLQFDRIQKDRDNIRNLMESRQEFYNNVTHELKTPLTTIQGYAQLLQEDKMEDTELFDRGIRHILGESTRLHQMVVQLLEMGDRKMEFSPEPVNLSVLAESVAAAMTPKAQRYSCRIAVQGAPSLITLGQEDRLRQVLINLTDNAIKYGSQGKEIIIRLFPRDGQAVLQVINQGEGIPADKLEEIFEPFCRINKEYSRELGSSGLGLSICRKIVREHQGTITAQSTPGKETIFTLSLKLWEEQELQEL